MSRDATDLALDMASKNLASYIRLQWPQWKRGRHIDELIKTLHRVERGEIDRLICLMPPRHSKSLSVSQYFPAWYLGRHPDRYVIGASYGQNLANDFGTKVRNLIRDPLHAQVFPNSTMTGDSSAKDHFSMSGGGQYYAVGRNASVVGRGAHLFVVDDPVSDKLEATSETLRRQLHEWFSTVAYTRLQSDAAIVICQCLAEGSRVLLSDGRNVPVESVKVGDTVWGWDEDRGIVPRAVTGSFLSGEDDTLGIATDRALITANHRHPFLVLVKDRPGKVDVQFAWRRAGEIEVGDILVTLKSLPEAHATVTELPGTDRLVTEDFMWMLGYLFGDGFVTRHVGKSGSKSIKWAVSCAKKVSDEKNQRLQDSFEREFGRRPYEPKGVGVYRLDSAEAGRLMWSLGLHSGAKTKRLPDWVFGTTAKMKRAFLRGLLDADGAKQAPPARGDKLGLVNFELVEAARMLAFQCGVRVANVNAYSGVAQPPNSPEPVAYTCYSAVFVFTEDEHEGRSHIKGPVPHHRQVRFDRVRSITDTGKRRVYDLTVEGHNFVAENVIVHNTLWNEDDLAGWLMREHMDDGWHILKMPAIATKTERDADGNIWRRKGDALWPEMWPVEKLERIKRMLTTEDWESLYQQECISDEGNTFKMEWLRRCKDETRSDSNPFSGRGLIKYIVVDPASSKKKGSDYTSMWVLGLGADECVYVLDIVRDKLTTPTERIDRVFALHRKHKPISRVFYEEYGLSGDIALMRERQTKMQYYFAITPVGGALAKTERIKLIEPFFRDARIRMPNEWWGVTEGHEVDLMKAFEDEYKSFPKGAHDDMLDALARIRTPGITLDFPATQESMDMEAMLGEGNASDQGSWLSA